jgi:Rod binding domain-containing protein
MVLDANGPRAEGCKSNDPQSVHKVAQEFESLLIAQMLKAAKAGFSAGGSEGADDSVMQYAQESLARSMSQAGGLGMAKLIESGLTSKAPTAD